MIGRSTCSCRLIGSPAMNFMPARSRGHLRTSLGEFRLSDGCGGKWSPPGPARSHRGLRPENFEDVTCLARQPPARITFHATIDVLESLGSTCSSTSRVSSGGGNVAELEELARTRDRGLGAAAHRRGSSERRDPDQRGPGRRALGGARAMHTSTPATGRNLSLAVAATARLPPCRRPRADAVQRTPCNRKLPPNATATDIRPFPPGRPGRREAT